MPPSRFVINVGFDARTNSFVGFDVRNLGNFYGNVVLLGDRDCGALVSKLVVISGLSSAATAGVVCAV